MTDIKEANFANILFFKKMETKQDNEIMIIIPILLLLSFFLFDFLFEIPLIEKLVNRDRLRRVSVR